MLRNHFVIEFKRIEKVDIFLKNNSKLKFKIKNDSI